MAFLLAFLGEAELKVAIGDFRPALHKAHGQPADGGNAKAAEFARKAADSIDRFSVKLREKEVQWHRIGAHRTAEIAENEQAALEAPALLERKGLMR